MKTILELLPDVILEAPGVPHMVALQAVSSSVRDFLTRTETWKEWTSALDVTASDPKVVIPNLVDDDAVHTQRMVRIHSLKWLDTGKLITFRTEAQLQDMDCMWRTREATPPSAFTQEVQTLHNVLVAVLYPIPPETIVGAVSARIVLTTHTYAGLGIMTDDVDDVTVPEFLFHQYRDTVVKGALARLLRMGGRDWTDKVQARDYSMQYENEVIRAKSQADAEFGNPVRTVTYGGY